MHNDHEKEEALREALDTSTDFDAIRQLVWDAIVECYDRGYSHGYEDAIRDES